MLRCILEKLYELNLDLHLLNIDFKQAYDTINSTYLHEILKEFRIPKKLVNLSKMMQDSKGKIQGQLTEAFGIERCLRESDALSTTVFNIVLEKVVRNRHTNRN